MSNAIEIENLYKEYRLGLIGYGTLREDIQSWWARVRGKEDPNSMLISGGQSRDRKTSDHILALNNINLTVRRGERLGIIGKNGAGKTTLLKILSRIASPTKGTVKIRGRVASLIAVGTGFHGELTGRENIYLNGSILGLRKFEIDDRLDEIVNFSGVEQFIDTPVKRYSTGMGVRLGFAVAAHLDPDVLIVDEVLAVGDAEFRKKALGKMKDVSSDEGRTILFVSHNMQSIIELCGNAILIDKGSIIYEGNSADVVNHYLGITTNKSLKEIHREDNRRDKIGDGSVHSTDFKMCDEKGNLKENYISGEKAFFHISFTVQRRIDELILSMGLLSNNTAELMTFNNFLISDKPLVAGYKGKVVLEITTDSISYGIFQIHLLFGSSRANNVYENLSQFFIPQLYIIDGTNRIKPAKIESLFFLDAKIESTIEY